MPLVIWTNLRTRRISLWNNAQMAGDERDQLVHAIEVRRVVGMRVLDAATYPPAGRISVEAHVDQENTPRAGLMIEDGTGHRFI